MSDFFPVALVIRPVGQSNVLVQSRGIPIRDVNMATDQFALTMMGIAASRGAENPHGPEHGVPAFASGTMIVAGGLFRAQYRLLNQLYVLCLAPPSCSSLLTGQMLQQAIQTVAVQVKALDKLSVEVVVKFYPEIYLGLRTVLKTLGDASDPDPQIMAAFIDQSEAQPTLRRALSRVATTARSPKEGRLGRSLSGFTAERSATPASETDGMESIPEELVDYAGPATGRSGNLGEEGEGEDGTDAMTEVSFVLPEGVLPPAAALAPDPRDLEGSTRPSLHLNDGYGQDGTGMLPPGKAMSTITTISDAALRGLVNSPPSSAPGSPRSVLSGTTQRSSFHRGRNNNTRNSPVTPVSNSDPFNDGFDDEFNRSGGGGGGGGAARGLKTPSFRSGGASLTTTPVLDEEDEDFDWAFLDEEKAAAARATKNASPMKAPLSSPSTPMDSGLEDLLSVAPPLPGGTAGLSPLSLAPLGTPPAPKSAIKRPLAGTAAPQTPDFTGGVGAGGGGSPANLLGADPGLGLATASPSPPPGPPPASLAAASAAASGTVPILVREVWMAEFNGRALSRVSAMAEVGPNSWPPTAAVPPLLSLKLWGLPGRTVRRLAAVKAAVTDGPSPMSFYVYTGKLTDRKKPILRAVFDAGTAFDIRPAKACLTCLPLPAPQPSNELFVLVALQVAANPEQGGIRNVDITFPPLPPSFGTQPFKCTPRAQWDERNRVLKWSMAMVRSGTEACPRALFKVDSPAALSDALSHIATPGKFYAEITFTCAPGANAPTVSGVSVDSFGAPLSVEVASQGRMVARPAFMLPNQMGRGRAAAPAHAPAGAPIQPQAATVQAAG